MNKKKLAATAYSAEPDEQAEAGSAQSKTYGETIWGQLPGEPSLWFGRFEKYRQQGPKRSLYAVYVAEPAPPGGARAKRADPKPLGSIPGAWSLQSKRWNWEARANAYDQSERELAAADFAAHRAEIIKQEWEAHTKLHARALEMLNFALHTRTDKREAGADGRMNITTILKPAHWSMGDAAKLLKVSSELGRLATGLETSRDLTLAERPPEQMSDDELYAIAARELERQPPAIADGDARESRPDPTGAA